MAKKKPNSKKTSSKKRNAEPAVPFEEALDQLKEVVAHLENGDLTLSESLEHYEAGVKNLKSCYQALEDAQKKIELLVKIDEDGNLITQPFDDRATSEPTRKTTRGVASASTAEIEEEAEDDDFEEDDDMDDPDSLF